MSAVNLVLVCICILTVNVLTAETPKTRGYILKKSGFKLDGLTANWQDSNHSCNTSSSVPGCISLWQYCDNGVCKCGPLPPYKALKCEVGKNLTVMNYYCVTTDNTTLSTFTGSCPFSPEFYEPYNFLLVLPNTPHEVEELMCSQFNRSGILCGKCIDDHYPLAYSFDMNCVKCPNGKSNWWKFLLVAFLPLTIFFFMVMLFKINITSSNLHGFVFFCQGIAIPALSRTYLIALSTNKNLQDNFRYLGSLYSVWNLDGFRFFKLDICLGTDLLQTLALDLAVGVYPLLLLMLSCLLLYLYDRNFKLLVIIWKPFKKVFSIIHRNWEIKTSLIDAFATFFLLSNMKFLSVAFDLLAPVEVYQLNHSTGHLTHSWMFYYNATVPYFGKRHLPYAILAITVLTLFVLLPTLLLILYPLCWFQRFLNMFPFRWYILHTFMDTFQGCYKDGTEPGTRDCRCFACVFFILRLLGVVIGVLTLNPFYFLFMAMLLVLAAILLIVIQPFKSNIADHSNLNAMFLLLLAIWNVSVIGFNAALLNQATLGIVKTFVITSILIKIITPLYLAAIIMKWMFNKRKFGIKFTRRLYAWWHGWWHGYDMLD